MWQHCRRPWSFTCEPCSFDSGRTDCVWVRRVWNGSADPRSRQGQDFGSSLLKQSQTKSVLPLSNEHGSQVKNQGRRQCCYNKHKNFPYTWCIIPFLTRLICVNCVTHFSTCNCISTQKSSFWEAHISSVREENIRIILNSKCHYLVPHSPPLVLLLTNIQQFCIRPSYFT